MKKGAKRSGFKEDHYTFYEGGKFEMRKKRIVSLCITMSLIIGSLHIWMIRAEANQSRYQYFASGYSYNSDPATYMVNIAKAQIGRTQSEFGYTEGWCDNFISDCAIIAKQEAAVPQGGAVSDFLNRLLSAGATKVSSPKAGDIVIFSSSAGYTHAGLMTDSTNCINGNFWSYGYSQVESPTSYSGINSYNGWTCSFYRPAYKPTHTHSYTSSITKAATCTATGVRTFSCSCGNSYTEVIPAKGHTAVTDPAVAATCTETGLTAGSHCSVCGATITAQNVVSAKGHDFGKWSTVKEATYTETGLRQRECKECSFVETETIPMLVYGEPVYSEWSEDYPDGVDASLIETKKQYKKSTKETTTSDKSSLDGWTPDGTSYWKETNSGTWEYFIRPNGFDTSKFSGYKTYALQNNTSESTKREVTTAHKSYIYWHWCRGTYSDGPIDRQTRENRESSFPSFHAFESTTNATYYDVGSYRYDNKSACSDTYWYYRVEVFRQTFKDSTKMYNYYKWSDYSSWQDDVITANDNTRVETRTVYRYLTNPHEHTPAEAVSENVVQPTCTTAGSYDSVIYCSECGEEISRETILIPAILYGDANGDDTVSINDVILIRKYLAELDYDTMISAVEISHGADANGDGTVNINDVVLIRKYLAEYDYDTESSSVILGPQ